VILGQRAIFDVPTAAIGLLSLGVLWRLKLHEPIVVGVAGLAGLVLWQLLRTGGQG
jgi:chromate transporter